MSRVTVAQRSVSAMPDASGPRSPQDCGGWGQHDACGLPWAPGQCSSMTTCDVSAMPRNSARRVRDEPPRSDQAVVLGGYSLRADLRAGASSSARLTSRAQCAPRRRHFDAERVEQGNAPAAFRSSRRRPIERRHNMRSNPRRPARRCQILRGVLATLALGAQPITMRGCACADVGGVGDRADTARRSLRPGSTREPQARRRSSAGARGAGARAGRQRVRPIRNSSSAS